MRNSSQCGNANLACLFSPIYIRSVQSDLKEFLLVVKRLGCFPIRPGLTFPALSRQELRKCLFQTYFQNFPAEPKRHVNAARIRGTLTAQIATYCHDMSRWKRQKPVTANQNGKAQVLHFLLLYCFNSVSTREAVRPQFRLSKAGAGLWEVSSGACASFEARVQTFKLGKNHQETPF